MSIFSDLFRSVGVYFSTKGSAPMEMFAERLVHAPTNGERFGVLLLTQWALCQDDFEI